MMHDIPYCSTNFSKKHVLHDFQIMVRTRGLARALGSGTDRGMGRDEDDIDVSRHRRPIASARRQRVQVDVSE